MRTFIAIVVDHLGWTDRTGMKLVAERFGAPRRKFTPFLAYRVANRFGSEAIVQTKKKGLLL